MQVRRQLIIEPIAVYEESLPRPIDWVALFANSNPVELEVGCGKGTFITGQAKARPQTNFFGIEWASFYWRYTCDRLRRAGCAANARIVRADAQQMLRQYIPAGSVSAIHIYFPDPWPKTRHHKRRLIQPAFLLDVHRALAPRGRLQVATDHADYFLQIQAIIAGSPLRASDYIPPQGAAAGEIAGTNFERKYLGEGRTFHAIAALKP